MPQSQLTRREFGGLALLAVPRIFHGVEIGLQTSTLSAMTVDQLLDALPAAGIGSVELAQSHVEPVELIRMRSPEARRKLREWRIAADPEAIRAIRRRFDKRGIHVNSVNISIRKDFTDEEIDAVFRITRAMGVGVLTTSSNVSVSSRVDTFARKYRIKVGFHNHSSIREDEFATPGDFEKALRDGSEFVGVNLDIGHFFAAGFDPVDYLARHHDRIYALHVKDRKKNQGDKVPFGQGDTNIGAALRLLRDNRWKIPANIEHGFPSVDAVAEVKRSCEFMKQALAS